MEQYTVLFAGTWTVPFSQREIIDECNKDTQAENKGGPDRVMCDLNGRNRNFSLSADDDALSRRGSLQYPKGTEKL